MKFTLSLVLTLFLMGSMNICSANIANHNPAEQSKDLASFKTKLIDFQLLIKRGDISGGRTALNQLADMAKVEYSQIESRKNWISENICNEVDVDQINYFIKGRESKQKELVVSIANFASQETPSIANLKAANKYLRYFYDSMEESYNEVMQVKNNCK